MPSKNNTKAIKASVNLKLRYEVDKKGKQRWVLKYARLKKDGTVSWADTPWKVRETSNQPRPVFFAITNGINFQLRKIPKGHKDFSTMNPKLRVALCEVAHVCSCTFEENEWGGFTWMLRGKPYLDFAILNYEHHKDKSYLGTVGLPLLAQKLRDSNSTKDFRRMERDSKAMFRIGIGVLKHGVWKFVPGKTLAEGKRK